jgi:membrane protein DedA with SNARE-associated domain
MIAYMLPVRFRYHASLQIAPAEGQRWPGGDRTPPLDPLSWITAPYDFLNWVADQIFLAMRGLYDQFGLPIVLLAALAEATVGLGAVFPGQVLMFLAGAYSGGNPDRLLLVYLVAIAGTATGDTCSYALGRWGGRSLEGTRLGTSLRLGRALMSGRARWMIPFYHLHSLTRTVGPFGAGAVRIPLWTWMPLDYLGVLISNAVWIGAGALLGTAVLDEDGTLKQHPALRIGLFVLAMTWFAVMQHLATKRLQQLEAREGAGERDRDEVGIAS